MAEVCHIDNRHDVICSVEGGTMWIKFCRLVQNDMSTAVIGQNQNQMWNSNMADIWVNFMACHPRATCHIAGCCHLANSMLWSQSHVSHLQGAATWWIHCHDSRATCHIAGCSHLAKSMSWSCHTAGCNNSIRHIENRFSPYFIFYCFLMQFGLW